MIMMPRRLQPQPKQRFRCLAVASCFWVFMTHCFEVEQPRLFTTCISSLQARGRAHGEGEHGVFGREAKLRRTSSITSASVTAAATAICMGVWHRARCSPRRSEKRREARGNRHSLAQALKEGAWKEVSAMDLVMQLEIDEGDSADAQELRQLIKKLASLCAEAASGEDVSHHASMGDEQEEEAAGSGFAKSYLPILKQTASRIEETYLPIPAPERIPLGEALFLELQEIEPEFEKEDFFIGETWDVDGLRAAVVQLRQDLGRPTPPNSRVAEREEEPEERKEDAEEDEDRGSQVNLDERQAAEPHPDMDQVGTQQGEWEPLKVSPPDPFNTLMETKEEERAGMEEERAGMEELWRKAHANESTVNRQPALEPEEFYAAAKALREEVLKQQGDVLKSVQRQLDQERQEEGKQARRVEEKEVQKEMRIEQLLQSQVQPGRSLREICMEEKRLQNSRMRASKKRSSGAKPSNSRKGSTEQRSSCALPEIGSQFAVSIAGLGGLNPVDYEVPRNVQLEALEEEVLTRQGDVLKSMQKQLDQEWQAKEKRLIPAEEKEVQKEMGIENPLDKRFVSKKPSIGGTSTTQKKMQKRKRRKKKR